MSYKPFTPNVTDVTGMLPVDDEAGNTILPEVEQDNVTYVTYVTGDNIDTCIESSQTQYSDTEKVYARAPCALKGGHVRETGNTVTLGIFPEVEMLPATSNTGNITGNISLPPIRNTASKPVVPAKAPDARTAPPTVFLGMVITQADMDTLLDRGRAEGFGVQGQWLADTWPCDWKLVKVWSLACGYNA